MTKLNQSVFGFS